MVVDDIVRGIMEDAAMWARAAVAAGLSLNASAGECDDVIRICDDVMRTSCLTLSCTSQHLSQRVPPPLDVPQVATGMAPCQVPGSTDRLHYWPSSQLRSHGKGGWQAAQRATCS